MNLKPTKAELIRYGSICYHGSPTTKTEVDRLEQQGIGVIGTMFLPRYDPTERHHFHVPIKWQYRGPYVYKPQLNEILLSHGEFLQSEIETPYVKKSMKNYKMIKNYINKWLANQNEEINNVKNSITDELQIGFLILVNVTVVSFARATPVAVIKGISKENTQIQLMTESETGSIVPVSNKIYELNIEHITRILSRSNNQQEWKIAYAKLKHQNVDYKYTKIKSQEQLRLKRVLQNYLGLRFKKAMNETNFVQFRKKQKP
eukprot:196227_1